MEWLGFATLITAYGCIFTAVVTGRKGWVLLIGWLIPILSLTITYEPGMQINGLMVLICFVMFLICRLGMVDVKMWNIRQRKKHNILFGILYVGVFILLFYSVAQAQIQGYMLNLQGWGSQKLPIWRMGLSTLPLLWLNVIYTRMVYTATDRLRRKRQELKLLSCRCFIANEQGTEKGLNQGYFLEGIQNGVTYHFRLTRRSYLMLRKETKLRLQTETGLFGGIYVTDIGHPEWLKRARRVERRDAKIGMVVFVVVMIFSIWLYWIR